MQSCTAGVAVGMSAFRLGFLNSDSVFSSSHSSLEVDGGCLIVKELQAGLAGLPNFNCAIFSADGEG